MIEATNADPAAVTKTLELVLQQAEITLRTLQQQAQVPDDQMVAPFVVSPPSAPAAGMPTRTRSTIAIFVAGAGSRRPGDRRGRRFADSTEGQATAT